jgi:hypothetical protein
MERERIGLQGVEWINLAMDMDQRWAIFNMLFTFQFPYSAANSSVAEEIRASNQGVLRLSCRLRASLL